MLMAKKKGKNAKGTGRKKTKGKKAKTGHVDPTIRSRLTQPGIVAVAAGAALAASVAGLTSLWRIRR
jgi:hypothetical protein